MPITFQDFVPSVLKSGFFANEYETLPNVIQRANTWIAAHGVRVIHVETVLLPNVKNAEDTANGVRTMGFDSAEAIWHQLEGFLVMRCRLLRDASLGKLNG